MLYTSNNVAAQGRLDETNQSQAKNIKARHSEIAMRYAWDGRRRGKKREPYNRIANIRLRELERLFGDRWGDALPDDDAGRDELLIALHHIVPIAECPDAAMKDWASVWADRSRRAGKHDPRCVRETPALDRR